MRTPSVPEDESAQLPSRHRHGRRRKKKRSKRVKNIITVVVLFIMVLVIVWFLVNAIMDLGGSGHGE
jgi:cytoskeletal protein RodZ